MPTLPRPGLRTTSVKHLYGCYRMNRMRRRLTSSSRQGASKRTPERLVLSALSRTAAGDTSQALIGRHDQTGQIVLNMPELTLVVKQVAQTSVWPVTTGAGATIGRAITQPFVLGRGFTVVQG